MKTIFIKDYTEILNKENTIYIFETIADKEYFIKQRKNIFDNNVYISYTEFLNQIFVSDYIVLREEKPALFFYKTLSKEFKKKYNFTNYYDFIDMAYNIINFQSILKEYKIKELKNLENWQQDYINSITKEYEKFVKYINGKNYTIQSEIYNIENLNIEAIKNYENIVFIEKINITPFEKEYIKKLKEKFNIINYLFVSEKNFDKKNYKLIDNFEVDKDKIEIYENKTVKESIAILLSKTKEVNSIYAYDIENLNFSIYKEYIKVNKQNKFENSNLYYVVSQIYNILKNIVEIDKKRYIPIKSLIEALYSIEVREYFDIKEEIVSYLYKYRDDGYLYIDENILTENKRYFQNEKSEKLIEIIELIRKLNDFKTLNEYIEYFSKEFNYKKFENEKYPNIIAKYFESLSEIKSLIDIFGDNWKGYFKNISEGLFRMILKYFRAKDIEIINENVINIDKIENIPIINDNIAILNVSSGNFLNKNFDFLLSEKQKEENGIITYDEKKLIEKYKFYRMINFSKNIKIFSLKDEEIGLDRNPFLEELIIKYNLNINKIEIDVDKIFVNNFRIENNEKNEFEDIHNIYVENSDFKNNKLNLGSYTYMDLQKCKYKYFLKYIGEIHNQDIIINEEFSKKIVGIFFHMIMEKISKKIMDENVEEYLNKLIKSYYKFIETKFPIEYEKYYKEIFIKHFEKNIIKFVYEMRKYIENSIETEKKVEKEIFEINNIKINMNGRIDAFIENSNKKIIIDYKTGSGDDLQLKFYEYLIGENVDKYIYDLWKGELINQNKQNKKGENKKLETEDILSELDFLNTGYYIRNDKKSICNNCEYIDICNEVKIDENSTKS
ncbi:MAG: hypothetical protein PWP46_1852 [Fusobacteriaceae bacterium]|nr:hypothetical protein [Fusobacteriaceae bacterium]